MPRRNNSPERLEEDEALRIEVLHPAAAAPTTSLHHVVAAPPSLLLQQPLEPGEDLSPTRAKPRPPSSLQIPTICLPEEDLSPKGLGDIVIPLLIVQTPSPPPIPGSPPPRRPPKLSKGPKRLLRELLNDKPGSLDYPSTPPMITVTGTLSEAESDSESPASVIKVSVTTGMSYLSPFSMCHAGNRSDHRTISDTNLSSSGYSSMASPGPSRCGSSNPLFLSEPDELLTPGGIPSPSPILITPPIPPPRKLSPLVRCAAIQQQQDAQGNFIEQREADSNDEGFGTDHLEDINSKLQLPSIVVQAADGPSHLSPVSSRSESPLSDKTCDRGIDRFSPLFYHKPELPFTDSDGLYDCPSSEVMTTSVPTRKSISNKKRERRRSNSSAIAVRGGSSGLGGLLEVPGKDSHQSVHRSARKPSPKRRAARLAPPSSSSSSESLNSFRGSRGSSGARQANSPTRSKGSPSRTAGTSQAQRDNGPHQTTVNGGGDDSGELLHQAVSEGNSDPPGKPWIPPPSAATRVTRKVSRMKAIGHQIRFLRRLEMSLRRREQQSPSDSLDTDLSSPTSSPTLPTAPTLQRLKARALSRRQLPGRLQSRCELATLLLGAATAPAQQDSD